MDHRYIRPGYCVKVDSLFLARTAFIIEASVRYDAALSDSERKRLSPRAQVDLLLAISGAAERGRRLGADSVTIAVGGDEPLARLRSSEPRAHPRRPRREVSAPIG